jgi:hypothetical protein
MLDQAVSTVRDFATGVAADKVTKVLGRLGKWVAIVTALCCAAFLVLPFVAAAGAPLFIALTPVWATTSSALRAPPLMLLGKYAAKPAIPYLSSLAMLGYGIAGALAPYLAIALRDIDPRWPFALASIVLVLTLCARERASIPEICKARRASMADARVLGWIQYRNVSGKCRYPAFRRLHGHGRVRADWCARYCRYVRRPEPRIALVVG